MAGICGCFRTDGGGGLVESLCSLAVWGPLLKKFGPEAGFSGLALAGLVL